MKGLNQGEKRNSRSPSWPVVQLASQATSPTSAIHTPTQTMQKWEKLHLLFRLKREKRQNFWTTVQLPPEDNLRNVSYLKGKVKYDSSLFWQIGIVSLI